MGQVYKIDARIKKGEVATFSEVMREVMGLDLFRRIACIVVPLLIVALGCWGVSEFVSRGELDGSVSTISTSVNATRRLYQVRPDVGEGSIIISLVLSGQYDERNVSIKWSEGGLLDVKNKFGGKLDVIALRNHFELHYYGVPKGACQQLITQYAKVDMPAWVNTMPVPADASKERALVACGAERNNMVWKFR